MRARGIVDFSMMQSQVIMGERGRAAVTCGRRQTVFTENPFRGTWKYRSFLNNSDHVDDINTLLFGEGDITVEDAPFGGFAGTIDFGQGYILKLRGSATYGTPFTVRFEGVGEPGPASGWVYDYVGYLVPNWPNGVNQIDAIVGSVIRTVSHNGGKAEAGVVASFVAVKHP